MICEAIKEQNEQNIAPAGSAPVDTTGGIINYLWY
jgi:hypothetical protein